MQAMPQAFFCTTFYKTIRCHNKMPSCRVTGGIEPIPADIGHKAVYSLDKWPVHRLHRARTYIETQTTKCNDIHTSKHNLESPIHLTCLWTVDWYLILCSTTFLHYRRSHFSRTNNLIGCEICRVT